MLAALQVAIVSVFEPSVLVVIVIAALYGIFVGSIPGLTATMAVALMVPMTFYMNEVQAVAAIVTTVTCSIFAGDIPATLVRIPGTPASAAYANDAYALARRQMHEQALGVSLFFSVVGGLFGTLVLVVAAPLLARVATGFTSYEYFWLYLLGLTCAAIVADDSRLKGLLALLIGLLLSAVGLGTDYSTPRLTFGQDRLITGINLIPAMIGLFGLSEVFRNALYLDRESDLGSTAEAETDEHPPSVLNFVLPLLWRRKWHVLRSSGIGSCVGMLPGAGADIAAWISYAVSKRFSRDPRSYGKGSVEGLSDATGANNAALGSAWIPALVFGIPGDSVTAIAIGVLLMKNITPGPNIFDFDDPEVAKQASLVLSIFVTFLLANLLLLPIGFLAIRAGSLLIRIPRRILLPMIVVFCIVGAFAMNGSYFDVTIMLVMGLLGWLLERGGVPLGPVVLGLLLGGPLEHKFIQCLSKEAALLPFFRSPYSIGLALACLALWGAPLVMRRLRTPPPTPEP